MLDAVDPLLYRIEALPEHGCYTASFVLGNGEHCGVTMRVEGDDVHVTSTNNTPAGWSEGSDWFRAVLAAIRAVDCARERVGTGGGLRDVLGGWDVRVGNVVLNAEGHPACVAHGELERTRPATFRCPGCGAQAQLGDPAAQCEQAVPADGRELHPAAMA